LFGLEQLFHGYRLVDMVLGLGDLFAGDEEPHIGVQRVIRFSPASQVRTALIYVWWDDNE
jgi:hypothetical protein